MHYRKLGRTGLKVSRLCLGTMNFGPETGEADSHALMDRALELGLKVTTEVGRKNLDAVFDADATARQIARAFSRRCSSPTSS